MPSGPDDYRYVDRYYDFDPRKIDSSIREALGLLIACSAQTELFLGEAITGCLGLDEELGYATTIHMSVPMRLSALLSCAEVRFSDHERLDQLDGIVGRLRAAFDKRNQFAHQAWARDPATGEHFLFKQNAKKRVEVELLPITAEELTVAATTIYDVGIELWVFLEQNHLLPLSVPDDRVPNRVRKAAREAHKKSRERDKPRKP